MTAGRPLLASFREAFGEAAEPGPLHTATVVIAGRRIGFRATDARLNRSLLGALAHHPRTTGAAELTVHAWCRAPAPRLGLPSPARRFDPAGAWRLGAERAPDYVTFVHENEAFVYAAGDVPVDRYATPLRSTLLWWFARHGLQGLHAAAVALDGRGVLLAGHGGAGKSTTALRCLDSGLDLLGDDITLVDPTGPVLHSLYSSVKAEGASSRGMAAATEPDGRQRTVSWLAPGDSDRLPATATLAALVVVARADREDSCLEPLGAGEALRMVAPNTMRVLSTAIGTQAAMFSACADLVRRVPCHRLMLGHDPAGVARAVRAVLRA
jgi:hypothetical protein